MTLKTINRLQILTAIVFAGLILLGSYLIDTSKNETITYILIAIWFVPFSYFNKRSSMIKREICTHLIKHAID